MADENWDAERSNFLVAITKGWSFNSPR